MTVPAGPIVPSPSAEDLETLALTIWGEARGEEPLGQIAVAWVVRNRRALAAEYLDRHGRSHPLYGNGTLLGVCRASLQFSCWNPHDPNRAKLDWINLADPAFQLATGIAHDVADGRREDLTGGATHYFATSIAAPSWAAGHEPTVTIGRHRFYRIP